MKTLQTMLASAALGLALAAAFAAPSLAQPTTDSAATPATAVDFGDDTSQWANDGECDDPRFAGIGSATELLEVDQGHDATDCRTAFDKGSVTLLDPDAVAAVIAAGPTDIDFGDDDGQWAKDGECDDPRFAGPGAATELLDVDRMHDATDCRAAFNDGRVTLTTSTGTDTDTDTDTMASADTSAASRIDFGDDSGEWAHDGECDDPDFTGSGMTAKPSPESRMRDASDCRAAFDKGTLALGAAGFSPVPAFDYGGDTSLYANDGECDDPRFEGTGTDKKLLSEDMAADASDCRSLEAQGQVSVRPVYSPQYIAGAPYDSTGVYFGDDTSDYANDDQCDDPRFIGPGTATTLLESDSEHDATDCRSAYEAGTVVLR